MLCMPLVADQLLGQVPCYCGGIICFCCRSEIRTAVQVLENCFPGQRLVQPLHTACRCTQQDARRAFGATSRPSVPYHVAGLTDLIGVWVELPSGIGHVRRCLANRSHCTLAPQTNYRALMKLCLETGSGDRAHSVTVAQSWCTFALFGNSVSLYGHSCMPDMPNAGCEYALSAIMPRSASRSLQQDLTVCMQATMALAFGLVAFLLGFHEKHNPLDQAVHTLQVGLSPCTVATRLRRVLSGGHPSLNVLCSDARAGGLAADRDEPVTGACRPCATPAVPRCIHMC
jgi:hypothetical protein